MRKIILVLKHRASGDLKEVRFKKGLRFANSIRKFMKDYDLVEVKGKSSNKIVQFLSSQIVKYADSPKDYKISQSEIFEVTASETKTSVEHVKKSVSKVPRWLRRKR